MKREYKVPCGKTTGQGESCVKGWLCGACTEIEALRKRVAELEASRFAYASEFEYSLTDDGMPDVGSIHENIRKLKRAYAEAAIDAERYRKIKLDNAACRDETFCLFWDKDGGLFPVPSREMDETIDNCIDKEFNK